MREKRIPVIFDTDIGGDIDDTWAMAMMLNCPELDVKLCVSDSGDTEYRARILAKMLEVAGRTDIPVGVGAMFPQENYPQRAWVEDYNLADYPGEIVEDGVDAIVDTIMNSPEEVKLICIGPVPNIAEALDREPRIVENAHFVGMHGAVYKGYRGSDQVCAEWNVRANIPVCQKALSAAWPITITPLDTCGLVELKGEKYQAVRDCDDPLIQALMENYRFWLGDNPGRADVESSVLFDTVAVYLAFSEELLEMKKMGIRVDERGFTVPDENAKRMSVALDWKDLPAFEDFLVARLIGGRA